MQRSLLLTLTRVHLGEAEAAKEQFATSHKHIFSSRLCRTQTHTLLFTPWYARAYKINALPRLFLILTRHNLDILCCRHVKDHDRLFAYNLLKEISAPYKARTHLLICWIVNGAAVPVDKAARPFTTKSSGSVSAKDAVFLSPNTCNHILYMHTYPASNPPYCIVCFVCLCN